MPRQERGVFWDETAASTRVRVRFHGLPGRAYSGMVDGYRPDFGSIIGFTSTKQKTSPTGTWSLTVKRPDRYTHEQWMALWPDPEGTWVETSWVCNGQVISGMIGMIDVVSHSNATSDSGAPSNTYTISGFDHGKVFEETNLWINIFDGGGIRNNNAMYQTMQERIDGTPSYLVRGLIEAWLGNYGLTEKQWVLPASLGGMPFFNALDLTNIAKMTPADGTLIDPTLINVMYTGNSLWATMVDYANPILNELFVDMAPRFGSPYLSDWRPSVYMRRCPFPTLRDRSSWERLRTRTLNPADVKAESTSRGGTGNRFNYWQIRLDPEGHATDAIVQTPGGSPGVPGSNPIWSIDSIRTHGMRRWTQGTKYLQMDNEGLRRTLSALASEWLLMCHDWYVVAPYQRAGTIMTTRVFPEIRIGEKLRLNRSKDTSDSYIDYYVEGVTNAWTHGQAGISTFTVTRGEESHENHLQQAYSQLGYAAQKTAFVSANPLTAVGAAPGAAPTLDQEIASANADLDPTSPLVEQPAAPAPLVAESSEADFNATQSAPSDPSMVNTLPPPSITTANAAVEFDASNGATESPTDVSPEPGTLSPAEPTQENVEDGRPVFIELDLEVQIGPGSAIVMGPDGMPVESEE